MIFFPIMIYSRISYMNVKDFEDNFLRIEELNFFECILYKRINKKEIEGIERNIEDNQKKLKELKMNIKLKKILDSNDIKALSSQIVKFEEELSNIKSISSKLVNAKLFQSKKADTYVFEARI